MSWKDKPKAEDLSEEEIASLCEKIKNIGELMNQEILGPEGFKIFHPLLQQLLFYAMSCIHQNKFPALNAAWEELGPLFFTQEFDSDVMIHCWMFCDLPLEENGNKVLLDEFAKTVQKSGSSSKSQAHLKAFCEIMKSSRLGLYQEVLSSSKETKFRELITGKVINTVRSVPEYESGEIFLTRLVTYMGETFPIHDPRNYPAMFKDTIVEMVRNKLFYISETGDEVKDYEKFMKLAGPYWFSVSQNDDSLDVFSPNHFESYYWGDEEEDDEEEED